MAGYQRAGGRAGVSGALRLAGKTAQYHGDTYVWSVNVDGQVKQRRGRGDTNSYGDYRILWINGGGMIVFELQSGDWPAPDGLINTAADIIYTIDTGKTITVPVLITGLGPKFDVDKQDVPRATLTYRTTGDPVFAGWDGTQPTTTPPTKANKELFDGTTKTIDPQGLQTAAQRLTDVYGTLGNTDSAEQTLIVAFIAASLPPVSVPHNLKKRPFTFQRDALDGGTLIETWGLTDTAEDVINANTFVTRDPSAPSEQFTGGIASSAGTAAINGTPPNPGNDSLVVRFKTDKELNDSKTLSAWQWGQTTPQQDWEFPKSPTSDDSSDLEDTQQLATIVDDDDPPGITEPDGFKLIDTQRVRLTDSGQYGFVFFYGRRTRQEAIEYDGSPTETDPYKLIDQIVFTRVKASATLDPPATPTGFVLRNQQVTQKHAATTGEKWIHVYTFGRRTSKDDVEMPGTWTQTDVSDLKSVGLQTLVFAATATATAATVPSGLVTRNSKIVSLNQVEKSVVYEFSKDTTKQEWEQSHSNTFIDASLIDSKAESAAIDSTSPTVITGGGLLKIGQKSEKVTHDHTGYTDIYDTITPAQKATFPKIETYDDGLNIDDSAVRCELYTAGGSAPTTPTDAPANNVKLIGKTDLHYNNGLDMRVWVYGPKSSGDKLVLPNYETIADASLLDDSAVRAYLDGDSDPGNPDAAQYQLTFTKTIPVTVGLGTNRTLTVKVYARLTGRDKLVLPHTWTETATLSIGSAAERAAMDGESAPAATVNDGNTVTLVKRGSTVLQITHPSFGNRTQTIAKYGPTSPATDIEIARTRGRRDPLIGQKDETTTVVASTQPSASALAGALMTSNQTAPTFSGVEVVRVPDSQGLYAQTILSDFEDKRQHSANNHFFRDRVRGVPETSIVTGAYLPGNISVTDTQAWVYINFNFGNLIARPLFIWRAVGSFLFRRVYNVSESDLFTKLYLSLRGEANNASFLGYSTGEVVYAGPAAMYLYSISGQKRAIVDYEFATDNWKHFNDGFLPEGRTAVNSGSILTSGLKHSTTLENGNVCTFPTPADFSGFTT